MISETVAKLRRLNVLVNNAGAIRRNGPGSRDRRATLGRAVTYLAPTTRILVTGTVLDVDGGILRVMTNRRRPCRRQVVVR
jgi:hypothetical protein